MKDSPSYNSLYKILYATKTIACIGVSANTMRPSHFVARHMHYRGYRVISVNPSQAGNRLFGEVVHGDLPGLANKNMDMINIFRRPEFVPTILDEVLKYLRPQLKIVRMQIGMQNEEAAEKAKNHDLNVIQNRYPKNEYQRLFGELRKAGFNTGNISSRLCIRPQHA